MALLEAKPFSVLICYILGFWIILSINLYYNHNWILNPNSDVPKMRTFGRNHTNGFMSLKRNDMSLSVSNPLSQVNIEGQFVGLWNFPKFGSPASIANLNSHWYQSHWFELFFEGMNKLPKAFSKAYKAIGLLRVCQPRTEFCYGSTCK